MVADLITSEGSIRQCVLSMSAAHLGRHEKGFRALGYRTDAITSLQADLSRISSPRLGLPERGSLISTLLLGTILLGMSSVSQAARMHYTFTNLFGDRLGTKCPRWASRTSTELGRS